MTSAEPVKRAYRSDVRTQRAESTRLSIIRAATALFVEHSYGPVSIDAVADAAEVSRATVFNAVGGKAALLRAAYDVAIVGDDEPVPLPERPWARPVRQAPDAPTLLVRYAHMVTIVDRRVAGIYEVLRGAAGAHTDVREHWEQIRSERRVGAGNVVTMVRERARLRERLTARAAADIVFVLIDPGLYHALVHEQGWKDSAFEAWLADTFQAQLLPPGGGD
jgi:AcrR family transcriptional regulator